MSEDKTSLENLRLEYSEANNNRRHYSNLRFAVLTVFFAVLGGVASVAFGIVEIKSAPSLDITRWARRAGSLWARCQRPGGAAWLSSVYVSEVPLCSESKVCDVQHVVSYRFT